MRNQENFLSVTFQRAVIFKEVFVLVKIVLFFFKGGESAREQRERERESQADSLLSTEPDLGLDPTTLRS